MKIPHTVLNPMLYKKAYDEVTKSYGTQTSAYRSMAIVKRYKSLGGKYKKTPVSKKSTTRWLKEQWIQVIPYIKNKTLIPCGASKRRSHACRPYKRVSKHTPITIKEVMKKHGKHATEKIAKTKRYNSEQVRIDWKQLLANS